MPPSVIITKSLNRRDILLGALAAFSSPAFLAQQILAAEGGSTEPQIRVAENGWIDAPPSNIQKVLESAAAMLWPHFSGRKLKPIDVSFNTAGPIVLHKRAADGAYRVYLDVKGTYWAQFAFQFAHEFCHILCEYRDAPTDNLWFEESLCEMASLYAVNAMAKSWETNPPYSNWKPFAPKLAEYADKRTKAGMLPDRTTLAEWYKAEADSLRAMPTQREKNLIVAAALLPLVIQSPGSWEAIGYLNRAPVEKDLPFAKYLSAWRAQSPKRHHQFIENISEKVGVKLA